MGFVPEIDVAMFIDSHSEAPEADHRVMTEKAMIPKRVVFWGVLLLVVAIAGNLSIPWLLDQRIQPLYATVYGASIYEALSAFFVGLWLAQYVGLWIWLNAYVTSKATRWLRGLFLSLAISCLPILGLSAVLGPVPISFFGLLIVFALWGLVIYAIFGWIVGTLLQRSKIVWRLRASERGIRYSIRTLLGAMVGSAILMLVFKWLLFNKSNHLLFNFFIAIWMAWLAVAMAVLIWLQLGSVFSPKCWRFRIWFFVTMATGPLFFQLIGKWLLRWDPRLSSLYNSEQLLLAYAIELGLVLGVAVVILLLPRTSSQDAAFESNLFH